MATQANAWPEWADGLFLLHHPRSLSSRRRAAASYYYLRTITHTVRCPAFAVIPNMIRKWLLCNEVGGDCAYGKIGAGRVQTKHLTRLQGIGMESVRPPHSSL